ncbi:ATP-dependent DNA helicase RecG [hydrothermal vent metagenome]|uniref:ATP-dependent DNA helicase RecG n=1 Tax=hydrothermal vent metagenome TaxID=652676 RepID=A0A3B0WET1_9ZZZZ
MQTENTENFEYQSVQTLKGVGPAVAKKLTRLEVYTIQDVLFHLPMRYEDRTKITAIGSLQLGQHALIEGVINHCEIKYGGKGRRSLLCHLSDNTGAMILRFFHFNKAQQANLSNGKKLRCFGEARRGATQLEFTHPEYQIIQQENAVIEKSLTPVYPKTEGIHQTLLKKLSEQVLKEINRGHLIDWLPEQVLQNHQFSDLVTALCNVHRPHKNENVFSLNECKTKAQQRLLFEELLAHQLSLLQARNEIKKTKAAKLPVDKNLYLTFINKLSFKLTYAQEKVIAEIFSDLNNQQPMLRLVQGDVGSGKTVVAAAAAIAVVNAGYQLAIMAPTEILVQQHFINFKQWFDEKNCLLLTGKDKGKKRHEKLEKISSGECQIIIGTHALFQDDVIFHQLVLLVVDEQHRFGVHQRLALREKGHNKKSGENIVPHQLIMTATPIPRSLAMTAYADLDYSVIDELPKGRKPVVTVAVSTSRRDEVIQRIKNACEKGEQAYWVCTLVEESDVLQCQAAEVTAEQLTAELKNIHVGLIHGRMKQEDKQSVIIRFKNKEIDLLIATTVIEVGVDVPNASLMVIENAERLGLAQLHQLRGRVGRGSKQSACVLMYQAPLSENGKQRLAILRETNDGFKIAERDLELRGPGEVLGTKQTGLMQMRIADIVRDEHWFTDVKKAAQYILKYHPQAVKPLVRRWLGKADRFANV